MKQVESGGGEGGKESCRPFPLGIAIYCLVLGILTIQNIFVFCCCLVSFIEKQINTVAGPWFPSVCSFSLCVVCLSMAIMLSSMCVYVCLPPPGGTFPWCVWVCVCLIQLILFDCSDCAHLLREHCPIICVPVAALPPFPSTPRLLFGLWLSAAHAVSDSARLYDRSARLLADTGMCAWAQAREREGSDESILREQIIKNCH